MFTFDISEVIELSQVAERALERDKREMHRILESKARMERSDHAYRNRTHMLEKSTFTTIPNFNGDVNIEIGARMHYASYVDNRGLMRLGERVRDAKTEIEYLFDGTADALSKW